MANGSRRMRSWHHATSAASKCFGTYMRLSYGPTGGTCKEPIRPSARGPIRGLPVAHAADVDMNEVRGGVVPDAAQSERERRLTDGGERTAGDTDVDRHGLHVKADARDAATLATEHGVGLGRAVAGDHLVGLRGIQHGPEAPQEIEEPLVHLPRLAGPEVAQDPVDLAQRPVVQLAVGAVDDVDALARVEIPERERA